MASDTCRGSRSAIRQKSVIMQGSAFGGKLAHTNDHQLAVFCPAREQGVAVP
jgi:hypothetical protein